MENKYGSYSPGSSSWTSLKKEEFQEEDVWGAFRELQDSISRDKTSYVSKGLQYPNRSIPNPNKNFYATAEIIRRRSTPLSIPDWPKINRTSYSEAYGSSCFWLDADSNRDENNRGFARSRWNSDIEEEDYDDGEFEFEGSAVIPPHIWISTKIRPSSSVCEGAGRTLKGRDLRRVRNAVLTKTGFLESKSNHW